MVPTSAFFIVAGIVCLAISVSIMPNLRPREGKPRSAWLKTEARETAAALGMFTLFVFGAALLAKGVLA
jgi:hypothetical protein